jgi:hypothetical protein
MPLRAEVSIPIALTTGALVVSIHQAAKPTMADVRSTVPGSLPHADVATARKQATWLGIGLVSGISLIAKDANIFIVGGATVIGMDMWSRYNNAIYPAVGRVLGVDTQAAEASEVAAGQGTSVTPIGPYSQRQAAVFG